METGPAGLVLGDEAFRQELVEAMAEKVGAEHYGEERQETSEGKAQVIVRAELKRRGWTDKTLKRFRAGKPVANRRSNRSARRLTTFGAFGLTP